jgi:hypothetical protein
VAIKEAAVEVDIPMMTVVATEEATGVAAVVAAAVATIAIRSPDRAKHAEQASQQLNEHDGCR